MNQVTDPEFQQLRRMILECPGLTVPLVADLYEIARLHGAQSAIATLSAHPVYVREHSRRMIDGIPPVPTMTSCPMCLEAMQPGLPCGYCAQIDHAVLEAIGAEQESEAHAMAALAQSALDGASAWRQQCEANPDLRYMSVSNGISARPDREDRRNRIALLAGLGALSAAVGVILTLWRAISILMAAGRHG